MYTCTIYSEEGLMKMAENVQVFNKMFSTIKIFANASFSSSLIGVCRVVSVFFRKPALGSSTPATVLAPPL